MNNKDKKYKTYTIIWLKNGYPLFYKTLQYLTNKDFIEKLYKGKIKKREYYMDYYNCKRFMDWLEKRSL